MTDYYVIDDKIIGHRPMVYSYHELIKALNNQQFRWLVHNGDLWPDWLVYYHDVFILQSLSSSRLAIVGKSHESVEGDQLTLLIKKARQWYRQAQQVEAWPGQLNYLAQSDLLGKPVSVPDPASEELSEPRRIYHPQHQKPHSSVRWKSGRVGHTMSANARYTRRKKALVKELSGIPLTHRNRHDRKHYFYFPVFDDAEYCLADHSTGWKYSTKCRHQYEIHLRNNWQTT